MEQESPPVKPVFDELNLDHIQQYLDGTIKIVLISKRDQDPNEFLQKNFENPNFKLKGVSSNNS